MNVQLIRVDDPRQIRKFVPENAIPALVINGQLVSSGYLPGEAEVRRWLSEITQVEQNL